MRNTIDSARRPPASPSPDGVQPVTLRRRLGPTLLTLYGVGVMVGAGIYVLVGTVAGHAGIWAPVAFVASGLIAAPTALTYAELSVRIPESAGEAAYIRRAWGSDRFAVGVGLAIVVTGSASAAAVLRGGVGYLTGVVDVAPWPVIIVTAGLLTALAVWGALESLAVAAVLTVVEIVGLLAVVAAGWLAEPTADWGVGLGSAIPWEGAGLAIVVSFFAFIGFEDIVNMAEETKRPERTLPTAILASLIITSLLYAVVAVAAVRAVPLAELAASDRPLALVFDRVGWSGRSLALIAAVAAVNGTLAQVVMASRVLFGLGRTEPLLAPLHRSHPRFGTPVLATVIVGTAVTVLALSLDVTSLAEFTAVFLLLVFCAMNATLLVLKAREGSGSAFDNPTWVPWLGLLGSTAALGSALLG
jgi:amino acid transporter